jgi:hypothetical protein
MAIQRVWRRGKELQVRFPYAPDNRNFLKSVIGERAKLAWNKKEGRWEMAARHFRKVVAVLATRGPVHVEYWIRVGARRLQTVIDKKLSI